MDPVSKTFRLEEVDWRGVLPWLRLFGAFRMAIQPAKLGLGLVMVLLLYLGGRVLDATGWWGWVYPQEIEQWARLDRQAYERWRARRPEELCSRLYELLSGLSEESWPRPRAEALAEALVEAEERVRREAQRDYERWRMEAEGGAVGREELLRLQRQWLERRAEVERLKPRGVFAAVLEAEVQGFERLIRAASGLRFGLVELVWGRRIGPESVLGALEWMLATVPGWLVERYPGFLAIMGIYGLVLWGLLGGAMARLAAVEACTGRQEGAGVALRFAREKWGWFIGTLLLPAAVAGVIGLLLAVFGLIFFNWPGLDVVGGALYGLAMLAGLMMVILLVGLILAGGLLYPALAVEETDGFDAVSRSFHYLWNRPWQWAIYQGLALVYGAVCYLILAGLVFLAVWVAWWCVGLGAFRETGLGLERFRAIAPEPRFGQLLGSAATALLDPFGQVAAVLVRIWMMITLGGLAAFVVSFYFCVNTWIYLLLRRSADGTEFSELGGGSAQGSPDRGETTPGQGLLERREGE